MARAVGSPFASPSRLRCAQRGTSLATRLAPSLNVRANRGAHGRRAPRHRPHRRTPGAHLRSPSAGRRPCRPSKARGPPRQERLRPGLGHRLGSRQTASRWMRDTKDRRRSGHAPREPPRPEQHWIDVLQPRCADCHQHSSLRERAHLGDQVAHHITRRVDLLDAQDARCLGSSRGDDLGQVVAGGIATRSTPASLASLAELPAHLLGAARRGPVHQGPRPRPRARPGAARPGPTPDIAARSPLGRAWRNLDHAVDEFVATQVITA
jgi:hypothetical protein